jgi:hypothetical protein
MTSLLDWIVAEAARRLAAEVEAACTEALTDGRGFGVLVVQYDFDTTVEVSPLAPYGQIVYCIRPGSPDPKEPA